jgi:hypothetical protein
MDAQEGDGRGAQIVLAVGALLPFGVVAVRTAGVEAGGLLSPSPILLTVGWLWLGLIWRRKGAATDLS